ncbi:asparaginase [Saprospiraceae bacterium]|nr:asparaginase [Saprospiraceae bacterium]
MASYIQLYVTGGTFDKDYNFITGELYFKDTHLGKMFDRGRSTLNVDIKTLMMVDSLEMSDEDREIVIHNCKRAKTRKIVITHGTDRMVETARELAKHEELSDKVIILTGAMIPYAFGTSSDGFFNLGASMAFVQSLDPGVYVCMNGRYFAWDNVRKNLDTGYFEPLKK